MAFIRERSDKALGAAAVFERAPAPDECWLLCAKVFAESDPERALAAYRRATSINPGVAHRVNPAWRLADLLVTSPVPGSRTTLLSPWRLLTPL